MSRWRLETDSGFVEMPEHTQTPEHTGNYRNTLYIIKVCFYNELKRSRWRSLSMYYRYHESLTYYAEEFTCSGWLVFFLIFLWKLSVALHVNRLLGSLIFTVKILKQLDRHLLWIFQQCFGGSNYFLGSRSTCKVTWEKWASLDKSAWHMKTNIGRLRWPSPLNQN